MALLANLSGCGKSTSWPLSGVYKGYYAYGFELSEFVPVGASEKWWLNGIVPCKPQYDKDTVANAPNVTPVLYMIVRGTLTTRGKHGHMDAYARELTAQQFLECRKLLPGEKPNL